MRPRRIHLKLRPPGQPGSATFPTIKRGNSDPPPTGAVLTFTYSTVLPVTTGSLVAIHPIRDVTAIGGLASI